MAQIILTPIADLIIGKLASYASDQVLLLRTLRPEIQKLEGTVKAIKAVLLDAEQKQSHNNQVKLWLERLSDFMYDADDLLDDFSTEVLLRRRAVAGRRTGISATCWSWVCSMVSSRPKQLMYDYKMARGIKAIREKLDEISEDRKIYNLKVLTEVALPSRETDSCPPTIVVGREDDKKEIIHLLLNSNSKANISTVPIVGMGGLGKTTLAQLTFDDHQIKDHFDIKAWVYVSQSFDVKVILRKMLRSIDRQSQVGPELDDLQAQLREKIKSKRFLFVLDDAWEENDKSWEALGKYLMVGALGSKVVVTTRSIEVAKASSGALKSKTSTNIVKPYELKGLSKEESWKLLVKKALPRRVPRDPQVQEIGKQILEKCGGVPLAVSTIAGVLIDSANPNTKWQSFLDKRISSIGKQGEEDPTMSTLQLSFNHLPSRMKHCFTYCKVFSKGSQIDVKQLLRFWVAQGYVESEDIALTCFQTLWWRSFFQEVEMDGLGNMSTCKMHDLMHDLVDTIAGKTIIKSSSSTMLQNIPSKTRHLIIHSEDGDKEEDNGDCMRYASQVRSLISYLSLSRKELKQVLRNCFRLRSLLITKEDSKADGEEDPVLDASIDKLKHLRYFGLNCTKREKIPDLVTNLINLQVLHLFDCESLKELPRDIKKLVSLKHLEVDPDDFKQLTHMPKGIGELQFLQTLPVFVVGKMSGSNNNVDTVGARLDELEGLNELGGELVIKGLANADSPVQHVYVLKEKLHLQSLVLEWHSDGDEDNNDDEDDGDGDGDDDDGDDNDDVTHDVFPLSTHDEGILEMLWPHPNLNKLKICQGYQGTKISNWLSGLTNLVEFSLKNCKRCEYLPSQMHQMSSLKKLTIKDCPMLKGIANDDNDCDSFLDNSITRSVSTESNNCDSSRYHRLSYLRIWNCPRLTRLPLFPTVEGELVLYNVSLVPFARTMKMKRKMRREGEGEGGIDYADDTNIHASPSSSSALVHPTLSKVTELTLFEIDDDLESLSYLDSSSCLVSLQKLKVWECKRGMKLPGSLCSSIYLTEIYISNCSMVEYLPPIHELPSLNKLTIWGCLKLKGCWWKKTKKKQGSSNTDDYYNFDPNSMEGDEQEKEDEEAEWPHFPCLSTLEIRDCPKLTRMPLFPTAEVVLLWGTSTEALVRTMKSYYRAPNHTHHLHSQQHSSTTATTTTATTASKLAVLKLQYMDDLESLPEEGLRNLSSLQVLWINECPRLATLTPAMRHLTSLQELYIIDCPLLRERCRKGEGEDWPNISHIPRIELDLISLLGLG